jgi:hypothetical protein
MLPQAGDFRVVYTPDGQLPHMLVSPAGTPVEPVRDYLLDLFASDCSPLTTKSYAFDLLDWFRFLVNVGVSWVAWLSSRASTSISIAWVEVQ